jgi:hypothetical protein
MGSVGKKKKTFGAHQSIKDYFLNSEICNSHWDIQDIGGKKSLYLCLTQHSPYLFDPRFFFLLPMVLTFSASI